MASRAILKRRRYINHYVNICARSIISSQWHVIAVENLNSNLPQTSSLNAPTHFKHIKDYGRISLPKEESFNLSALGQYRQRCYKSVPSDHRLVLNTLISIRCLSQSLHRFSTPATKQSELGSDDEKSDEMVSKKRKEASPEECDQAVEGLSTAKAKAKAKRLQEPHKVVRTILNRLWAVILGIGPAFRAVASMSREDWVKKLVHWKGGFVSTLKHYWLGFKLLWVDVRISSRLLLKLAGGKSLSRRERQQLTRTTADIFRLVPFAVFIIVPFMEFLLPVFLKLFPNMLPSTFQDKMKEQEALKRRLHARIEYAKFLQDTVKEMAKEVQNSHSGEIKRTAEDLDEFLNKVRRGARVSNDEILGFAKLFNDELTLDNISRPRLVNMWKYMGISPFGTDAYLRYMLRKCLQRWENFCRRHSQTGQLERCQCGRRWDYVGSDISFHLPIDLGRLPSLL